MTLGRDTDPSEDEIHSLDTHIEELGIAAWLVSQSGDYYNPSIEPDLLEVRRIGRSSGNWEDARAAFLAIRKRGLTDVRTHVSAPWYPSRS